MFHLFIKTMLSLGNKTTGNLYFFICQYILNHIYSASSSIKEIYFSEFDTAVEVWINITLLWANFKTFLTIQM